MLPRGMALTNHGTSPTNWLHSLVNRRFQDWITSCHGPTARRCDAFYVRPDSAGSVSNRGEGPLAAPPSKSSSDVSHRAHSTPPTNAQPTSSCEAGTVALQGLLLTSKGADTLGPCSLGRRESDGEPRGKHRTLFPLPVGHAGHSLSGPTLPPRRHKPLEGCFPFWPCGPPPHRPLLDCEVHLCVAPPGDATREWTMQGAVVVMAQSGSPARGHGWGVAAGVEAAIRRPINRLPSQVLRDMQGKRSSGKSLLFGPRQSAAARGSGPRDTPADRMLWFPTVTPVSPRISPLSRTWCLR